MRNMTIFALLCSVTLLLVTGLVPKEVRSQSATPVQCGDIVEGEFTENMQSHDYLIQIKAGQQLNIQGESLGDTLEYVITLHDATDRIVMGINYNDFVDTYLVSSSPLLESGALASNSQHTIRVSNSGIQESGGYGELSSHSFNFGGLGVYILNISCTMRDGTVIEAGSTAPVGGATTPEGDIEPNVSGPAPVPSTLPFSGVGFPGLSPVDFSSIIKVPFNTTAANQASFSPTVSNVLGFTVDATAGDTFELSYQRLSGNLNLGLVVLSADNEVFFQASLVTSDALSTSFTLPKTGEYTVGLFRIDLVDVASPTETAIELTGQLNP